MTPAEVMAKVEAAISPAMKPLTSPTDDEIRAYGERLAKAALEDERVAAATYDHANMVVNITIVPQTYAPTIRIQLTDKR